ncbi:DUF2971 domain-containing protein [Hirschia baltica]|uniref:DUF2971 domain-containing protein n=1 Tax=Hirschia baltica (strain ATCC 49814 / DSM 5838 / IFAM 1418) TaxID=582402 RepID=C6XIU2_HIRBI|nr:DUF2971 domain-containing protein [Hirschia baltica]ACT59037.1 conserved hypothetical protein [Hirschia baltica ATCC 49814]
MKPLHTDNLLFGAKKELSLLYHYTKAEIFNDFIAPSMKLKMNSLDKMNDPRESTTWEFDWLNPINDEFLKGSARLNDDIRTYSRLTSFCRDELHSLSDGELDHFDVTYKRGFSRPRMWAQYGGDHSGVCLVFDTQKLLRNFKAFGVKQNLRLIDGKVEYANRKPNGNIARQNAFTIDGTEYRNLSRYDYAQYHVEKHYRELLFTKHLDWRDENEYRIMLYGQSKDPIFVPFFDALKYVVLGSKCEGQTREKIVDFCCSTSINAAYLKWKNGYPEPLPLVLDGQRWFR